MSKARKRVGILATAYFFFLLWPTKNRHYLKYTLEMLKKGLALLHEMSRRSKLIIPQQLIVFLIPSSYHMPIDYFNGGNHTTKTQSFFFSEAQTEQTNE